MSAVKGRPSWNAGTGRGWVDQRGYRWIYVVENGRRRAKREHRHVIEQSLGRTLHPEEVVHHVNGIKSDNRPENLRVEQWGDHTTHHHAGSERSDLVKRRMEVLASYREEHKRLRAINADLLEALKLAEDYMHLWMEHNTGPRELDDLTKIEAAIAKAEGMSR